MAPLKQQKTAVPKYRVPRRGPPPFYYLVLDAHGVRRGVHASLGQARRWAQMVGDGPGTICRYRRDRAP
jgi:hypothetical protein